MKNNTHHPFSRTLNNQKGVSAILVAIILPVLIGFVALAIDVGYMYTTKNELQNIADAAALAGAGELGRIYLDSGAHDPSGSDDVNIKNAAKFLPVIEDDKNKAAGQSITPLDDDIEIGVWDNGTFYTYVVGDPDRYPPDAVRVTARTQGPVSTFFARIFNVFNFQASAVATAALSGPSIMDEGVLNLPIGLSETLFPDKCGSIITFSGTNDSCAGWHNFFLDTNTTDIRRNLLGIIAGHEVTDPDILSHLPPDGIDNGLEWLETYYAEAWDKAIQTLKINEDGVVIGEVDISDPDNNTFNFTGGEGPFLNENDITLNWAEDYSTAEMEGSGSIASFPALFDYFRMRDEDEGNHDEWTTVLPVYADDVGDCQNPNTSLEIVGFATVTITGYGPHEVYMYMECELFEVESGRSGGANFGNLRGSIPSLVE